MGLIVAQNDLPKPLADLACTMMLPASKLGLNGFELRSHPLRHRDSPDGKGPTTPELPTIMGGPRNTKVSGFPSPRRFGLGRHTSRTQSAASCPEVIPNRTSPAAPQNHAGIARRQPGSESPTR